MPPHSRRNRSIALALAILAMAAPGALADGTGGAFVAVGGGSERPEVIQAILRLLGGKDRRIVVLPTASGDPSASGLAYKQFFLNVGLTEVESLPIPDRQTANELDAVRDIGRADLLYFTGGDQNRLVSILGNTATHGSIQTAWQRSAILAGTSAGAMVWGPEFIANGSSQGALKLGFSRDAQGVPGLELRPGLNLWDNLVVDTHFTEQQRLGRLLLAAASSPGTTGLGIDEGTAAIITQDTIQAVGIGTVTVLEADRTAVNNAQAVGPGSPLALGKVAFHRLLPGKTYVRKWKTIQEDKPLPQADNQAPVSPYMVLAGTDVPRKNLAPIADFVRASGGSQARILLLAGERASQGAGMWRTHLLKQGASQVVTYSSLELSDQGLAIALQHATGIFMLEDPNANLLKALRANQGRLGQVIVDASKRLPIGAAGNGVRLFGAHAIFGSPGTPDYQSLPGLGLLPSAVVDKTFWVPDAMERLLRAQLQANRALGIGLSPDNAVVVSGGQATVFGDSQVVFVDAQDVTGFSLAPDASAQPSGATNLGLSVLPANGSYDLVKRAPRF